MTFDRHEAECARIEAEFNGTDEFAPVDEMTPEFFPTMLSGQFYGEVERLFMVMADRIRALEAKLDEHGII